MGFKPPLQENEIARQWGQRVRKTLFEAHSRIVMKTPVDTGHASMNWHTSVGGRVKTILEGGGKANPELQMSEDALKRIENFEPCYIQNDVPYIGALEYGHSKQAPNGMVRTTIEELSR